MQLSKVQIAANDALLFGFTPNATLTAVLALKPTILIDTTASYFANVIAYVLNGAISAPVGAFALINAADDTLFVPAGIEKPMSVSIGTAGGFALRFGFGDNLSPGAGNGYLVQQQKAAQNMSGSYTAAFVARRPTATELGGANPGAGPIIGSNNPSSPRAGIYMNFYSGMGVWHDGSQVASDSGGETVGTSIAYLVSYDSVGQTVDIWRNGTHVSQTTGVATPWTAGNQILLGAGLSSSASEYAVLDIAGIALFPNVAMASGSAAAATVNAWLNACRANVT